MRVKATAPRGKWSIHARVSSLTMKAVDDEEEEDMSIVLKCLTTGLGPKTLVAAAKKHVIVAAEHARGICDEATCSFCAAYAEQSKTAPQEKTT